MLSGQCLLPKGGYTRMLSVDNACCLRVVTQECCLWTMLVTLLPKGGNTRMLSVDNACYLRVVAQECCLWTMLVA